MRVLITGATGLIGKEIVKKCHEKNIAVNYLTTSKNKLSNKPNLEVPVVEVPVVEVPVAVVPVVVAPVVVAPVVKLT